MTHTNNLSLLERLGLTIDGGMATDHRALSEESAAGVVREQWGLDARHLRRVATEKDDSFFVDTRDGQRLVLKVSNPNECPDEVDFEVELTRHVASTQLVPVPRYLDSLGGGLLARVAEPEGRTRLARLMTRIDGTALDSTYSTSAERHRIGETLAHLRIATSTFAHRADRRIYAWDVCNLPGLGSLLADVSDAGQRGLVEEGFTRFVDVAADRLPKLRKQVLHNDFSKSNLIVDHDTDHFINAVLDFGDSVHTAVAVDVSTALLNQLPRDIGADMDHDILADGRDVLRGYLQVTDLTDEELELIPHLVMGRVVLRALITLHRAAVMPRNAEYILRNTGPGWAQLRWFLHRHPDELSALLSSYSAIDKDAVMTLSPTQHAGKMNNAFNPASTASLSPQSRAMVTRRARLLGPAYRLFYEKPVQVNRGCGTRLWDTDGNEYLDAYNNVVSVGHAHPCVVDAVHRQMQTLCTHTRYLQDGILDYAEQLLATLDGRTAAGHAMFTCTGSEANDLALRIAQHYTGNKGIIVTSEAYHGNSQLTAGFSPALGDRSPLGTWVRRVPTPDSYRVPADELVGRFTGQVKEAIRDIERRGERLAAFVVDSLFTSDGIYSAPTELLGPAVDAVHAAGGLFVADEVQCGFARTGDRMWGYQRHGVDPDIVTMGKPMGNGYPVAGIAVVADVVAGFGRDMRYFNTFGGNTVAMAAAQATLDVIRDEQLQANANRVGSVVRDGLAELAQRYQFIGDVRGAGLYVGVEIVSDAVAKTPDTATATAIVNGLRERRVLISSTGESGNVLKIRPPLVFSADDADRLLAELGTVLADLEAAL